MSIDINNIGSNRPDNTRRQEGSRELAENKANQGNNAVQPDNTTPSKGESVSLSAAAKGLAKLENELKELPEVDESKVAEIKARLDRGDYQVDAKNMAQKMLDMES